MKNVKMRTFRNPGWIMKCTHFLDNIIEKPDYVQDMELAVAILKGLL